MAIADLVSGKIDRAAGRPRAGRRPRRRAGRRARLGRAPRRAHGRPEVHRPARDLAAHGHGAEEPRRGGADGRDRLRRLVDPRLPGDLRVRHAAAAGPVDGGAGSRSTRRRRSRWSARCSTRSRASPYTRDPRHVAIKAQEHLRAGGVADVAYFGPEAEFYVFDHVAFDQQANTRVLRGRLRGGALDLGAGVPAARRGAGRARLHEPLAGGLFPRAAERHAQRPARHDGASCSRRSGSGPRATTTRSAGPGQGEIDLRFLPLLEMADALQLHKYVVKNTARLAGKSATFLPKPIFEENGSGMHVHQSLWKGRRDADARGGRLRAAVAARPALRGRPARARAGADGVLRAGDQLLPPAGPRLRGAGAAQALPAQPIGGRADPDVLGLAEVQAAGVPPARPARQPLPRLPGDAHGRTGRHRARAGPRASRSTATSTSSRPSSSRASPPSRPRSTRRSTRSRPTTRSLRAAASSPTT